MNKTVYYVMLIVLVALAGGVGWYVGNDQGKQAGIASMKSQVEEANRRASDANDRALGAQMQNAVMEEEYKKPDPQPIYIQQPQRSSLNCNSYSYGTNSVSTSCY